MRDLIVPRLVPVMRAISSSEKSSMKCSNSAVRCVAAAEVDPRAEEIRLPARAEGANRPDWTRAWRARRRFRRAIGLRGSAFATIGRISGVQYQIASFRSSHRLADRRCGGRQQQKSPARYPGLLAGPAPAQKHKHTTAVGTAQRELPKPPVFRLGPLPRAIVHS